MFYVCLISSLSLAIGKVSWLLQLWQNLILFQLIGMQHDWCHIIWVRLTDISFPLCFNSRQPCYQSVMNCHGDILSDSSGHFVTVCPPCCGKCMFSSLWFCGLFFYTNVSVPLLVYTTGSAAWCCRLNHRIYGFVPCYLLVIAPDTDRPAR